MTTIKKKKIKKKKKKKKKKKEMSEKGEKPKVWYAKFFYSHEGRDGVECAKMEWKQAMDAQKAHDGALHRFRVTLYEKNITPLCVVCEGEKNVAQGDIDRIIVPATEGQKPFLVCFCVCMDEEHKQAISNGYMELVEQLGEGGDGQ